MVGALTILGQAGDDDDVAINRAPIDRPTTTPTTSAADDEQVDRMIGAARGGFPDELAHLSDDELLDLARKPCERFADGNSAREVLFLTASSAGSPQVAQAYGFVAGIGVAQFCPQHAQAFSDAALEIAQSAGD